MITTRDVFNRLAQREDTEHTQALLRVVFVTLALIGVSWNNGFSFQGLDDGPLTLQITALLSTAFSLSLLYHIINRPQVNQVRRFVGMVHDVSTITILFYFGEEIAALFLFVYPFSAIGNGFRYGEKWLLISALLGATGLALLLGTSDHWRNLPMISTGLAINFLTVVTYTGLLLRKLRGTTEKLKELATHDALTGLPNRRLIMDRLHELLAIEAKSSRQPASELPVACVYFDLDGFKLVNDTLGHAAGDDLLKEVAVRVRSHLRPSDSLARLGGDEFTILLTSLKTKYDAEAVCRRVVKTVESITTIAGKPIKISVSVGCVTVSREHLRDNPSVTGDSVMSQADSCMYKSKKSGKGCYTIADHSEAHVAAEERAG